MARLCRCLAALLLLAPPALYSQAARFDLAGPRIDIRVTRNNITLPIDAVPNLQPGDQLWLHPDFPASQSANYLLICAFLRGTTNPPPESWFTRIETWKRPVREEGVYVTVPQEAQQAVLFLAPETGGDFSTLRSAVRGRPGIFVRATQDLNEAGFEQARIETYLDAMKRVPPSDQAALLEHSNLLARTLNLKPNADCFKRPLDQQYNCLTQTGTQTLLDDGHGQSVVAALSSGSSSDFINAASSTSLAGGGTYSAYVGAIVDLARLLNGIHTAQYQYIPAIAFPDKESLNLRLNVPPSFHNPKSVIVIGLPAVQAAVPPPLRPADPAHVSCLLQPHVVLPIEGAPLVFSTHFAHGLVLHLDIPGVTAADDIPVTPDAFQGGLVPSANEPDRKELLPDGKEASVSPPVKPAKPAAPATPHTPGAPIAGTIRGFWGFDSFTGPTVKLQREPGAGWHIVSEGSPANLIAGQPNHLELTSTGTACLRTIQLEPGDTPVEFKPGKPDENHPTPVDVTLNLQHAATPGSIRLAIQQWGRTEPDQLGTKTFAEPAKITGLVLHLGDTTAQLAGNSLDQVQSLTLTGLKDATFAPVSPQPPDQPANTLLVTLPAKAKVPSLKPNERVHATVELQDGRTLETSTLVQPARPLVTILSRRVTQPTPSPIRLDAPTELPLGAQLTFFLKSRAPFSRNEHVEIASADQSLHTTLTIAAGSLVLQDAHTILASFDPLKLFGPSTFGPFNLRAVDSDGTAGDWLPLAAIVRLPTLTALTCPAVVRGAAAAPGATPCQLTGSALYLIDSVATDAAFTNPIPVPEGFVNTSLPVPHPTAAGLYLRLRDEPTASQLLTLPVTPEPGAHPATRPPVQAPTEPAVSPTH